MIKHIIKFDHDDGVELKKSKRVTYCGEPPVGWSFVDASHAILSIDNGALAVPCKKCLMAISEIINDNKD